MDPSPKTPSLARLARTWALLIGSALLTAAVLQAWWREPWFWAVPALLLGRWLVGPLLARRSLRRLVMQGNVDALLQSCERPLGSADGDATVRPLMRATVLAVHGWANRAEQVLALARKGRTWEQSLEHRLMLGALLACLNEEVVRAEQLAECLACLPLPVNPRRRKRSLTLRRGTLAMARAYAHRAEPYDVAWMRRSARANPLLTWPMRYAELLVRIDRGEFSRARSLLAALPDWPAASCFRDWTSAIRLRLELKP
jgi:hypothetical protein